jgi:magnesium transporter
VTAEEHLAKAFIAAHPARAALALEQMGVAHAAAALRVIDPAAAATLVREMPPTHAADCLATLAPDEAAGIVVHMPMDDAAPAVRAMRAESRAPLLAALPEQTGVPLSKLLQFPPGTAGALMDPSIFQLPDDVLVADARTRLRGAARELLYYLYVVDREHRLVGVLDIPELMLARTRDTVAVAMHRNVERLHAWMPAALVLEHPGWHRYHAMPVVDESNRLLGAVRYQTLRKIERDAADRGPNPALLTARALGELFQVGTTGLVAGVAATASAVGGNGQPDDTSAADQGLTDAR